MFYGNGASFLGCLWTIILPVPIFAPVQGPSSVKMVSSVSVSKRLAGYMVGWRLLPPFGPSQIILVSFWWQHHVPYRDLLL